MPDLQFPVDSPETMPANNVSPDMEGPTVEAKPEKPSTPRVSMKTVMLQEYKHRMSDRLEASDIDPDEFFEQAAALSGQRMIYWVRLVEKLIG